MGANYYRHYLNSGALLERFDADPCTVDEAVHLFLGLFVVNSVDVAATRHLPALVFSIDCTYVRTFTSKSLLLFFLAGNTSCAHFPKWLTACTD